MLHKEMFKNIISFYKSNHTSSRNIDSGDINELDE